MREGWKSVLIKDVARVVNGGTPKTKVPDYWDGHHLWITPAEMGRLNSPYLKQSKRKLTDAGLQHCSASLVPAHSVILSTRAPIGHLVINSLPMAFNQGCRGIVPSELIHYKYLYYFLGFSVDFLNDLGSGTTFKELAAGKLNSVELPLPPLPEQKRIVAILDEAFSGIDTAIANTEKNLANARELFESYLNAVFSRRDEGWQERLIGDKSLLQIEDGDRGKNYPKKSDFYSEGFCLFLNTKNVRPDGFNFDSLMFISKDKDEALRKGKLRRRDVLLTTRGTIGNVAIYDDSVPYENIRINSGMLIFRPNEGQLLSEFLFEMLRSSIFKRQVEQFFSGAAQPQLPIKTLVKFTIPVPDKLDEQKALITSIRELEIESRKLESIYQQKLTALAELKQSLLQKAFSGELTADNVVPITSAKKSSATPTTDSPAFAAYIMAAAYHWHESKGKNKTFGHVKAQKTLHLVEALAQIDLGRVPVKDAAGPNDFAHMRTAETWARENDFYQFVQRAEGQRGYDFVKGKRYNEWLSQALDALEPYKSPLDRVVSLLMPLDTQQAELVATAYAAWNNLLLDGHKPSETDIVHEARDNWHRDKQQYTESQFHEAIARLRDHGMVPTGTGKRVTGQESLEL